MKTSILCNTSDQFYSVLGYFELCREDPDEIIIEADSFSREEYPALTDKCHEKGMRCILALPYIFRSGMKIPEEMKLFDGVLARAMGEIPFVKKTCGEDFPVMTDHNLYAMNTAAAGALAAMGIRRMTLPVELNEKELTHLIRNVKDVFGEAPELMVYGHIHSMVSAQCIKKNTSGCSRKRELTYFTDRTGRELTAENRCAYCYNIIYNADPLSLFGVMDRVKKTGAERIRISFTTEKKDEIPGILSMKKDPEKFTRGHFTRGVE